MSMIREPSESLGRGAGVPPRTTRGLSSGSSRASFASSSESVAATALRQAGSRRASVNRRPDSSIGSIFRESGSPTILPQRA